MEATVVNMIQVVIQGLFYIGGLFLITNVVKFIKGKELESFVKNAVIAAKVLGDELGLDGDEKFQVVFDDTVERFANGFLGRWFDEDMIESMIESTYQELKKDFKEQWEK